MVEYLVGAALGIASAGLAHLVGFDRSRSFYPVLLIAIASYYVLFAAMAGATSALWLEVAISGAWVLAAVKGFRSNLWIVVAGLAAHALFDAVHGTLVGTLVGTSGVPRWWPGFCLAFDLTIAAYAAFRIRAAGEPPEGAGRP